MKPSKQAASIALLILPLCATVISISYTLAIHDQPFFKFLVVNPLIYDSEARLILDGAPRSHPFFLSPLYPAFVASVYFFSGCSHLGLSVVQSILLGVNVLLIGLLGRRYFSSKAGVLAALFATLYWSWHYFVGEVVPVTPLLSLMLLSLVVTTDVGRSKVPGLIGLFFVGWLIVWRTLPGIKHIDDLTGGTLHSSAQRYVWAEIAMLIVFACGTALLIIATWRLKLLNSLWNMITGGILAGASLLMWAGSVPVALCIAWLLLRQPQERLKRFVTFSLGVATVLVSSLTFNYIASGDVVPVTTSFGVNLYIGNNPGSDGVDPFRLGKANWAKREADRLRLEGAERSRFFAQKSYEFVRSQPLKWIRLMFRKLILYHTRYEIDNNADIDERKDVWGGSSILVFNFGIVFPLALAGIVGAVKRKKGEFLVVGYLLFMLTTIIFFVCERFRVPATMFLIMLAAYGTETICSALKSLRWTQLLPIFTLIIAGAVVSNIDFLGISELEFPAITVNKAYVARLSGEVERAEYLARQALKADSTNAGGYFQLGAIEEQRGNLTGALDFFLTSLRFDPFFLPSYRHAREILERANLSPSYLDLFVCKSIEGEDAGSLRDRILKNVAKRLTDQSSKDHSKVKPQADAFQNEVPGVLR